MKTYILVSLSVLVMLFAGCLGEQPCPDVVELVCGADGVTYKNPCTAEKAGVQIEHDGACSAQVSECEDSDGGKDIFTSGNVISEGRRYSDSCKGTDTVEEYFCENGTPSLDRFPCPMGYECKGNRCAAVPCDDSDGGIKIATKGTAVSGTARETDECATNGSLKEFFCEDNEISFKYVECPANQQCIAGACTEYGCEDSDGGKDEFEKGTTTDGDDSETDSCYDEDTVTEYFCAATGIESERIDCGSGYNCVEGECVESQCVDSDNGKDQYTKGTTSYGDDTYEDSCYSDTQVLEYFCSSETEVDVEKIYCGTDHECFNGQCRIVECLKDEESIDEEDVRYEIAEFDSGDKLTLYVGNAVEINNDMILKLHDVGGTTAYFRLYEDYGEFQDNDELCADSIDEGLTENDLCGENTGDIEVDTVDSGDDYAQIYLDEYYAMQYYSEEGTDIEWSGPSSCPDDEKEFTDHTSYFYPYLDTSSTGLDLDGERFRLFDELAEIKDIDTDTIEFELDNEDYNLEDGDTFEYNDKDYEIDLFFNDGGLYRITIQED